MSDTSVTTFVGEVLHVLLSWHSVLRVGPLRAMGLTLHQLQRKGALFVADDLVFDVFCVFEKDCVISGTVLRIKFGFSDYVCPHLF